MRRHVLLGRHRPRTAPSVTEADQCVEREFPDARRLLVGQPGPRQVDQKRVGSELGAEQGHVSRGVGQRREKRGKHGVAPEWPVTHRLTRKKIRLPARNGPAEPVTVALAIPSSVLRSPWLTCRYLHIIGCNPINSQSGEPRHRPAGPRR